jgi:hemolysin activation/secretion protein
MVDNEMVLRVAAPIWAKGPLILLWTTLSLVCFPASAQESKTSDNAAPGKTAEAYFNVHEYRVLGNTALANREIEGVLYPLLGDHKTIADVEAARAALEKTYHDHGYQTVFVDIPEQDVGEAIVRLHVTEGKLRQVSISGARYFSERKILASIPAASAGTVLAIPALQAQLAAVNSETSDRTVVPILKAGPTPGTVDLALKVDDRSPFHGSLEVNNQYSPDTKPLRATVALNYNNLFNRMDSVAAQFQEAPQQAGQVDVFAADYALGPLANGLRTSVSYIHSNSNAATIGTIGVLGKGDILGLRLDYPFYASPGVLQAIVVGIDYKHFRDTIGLDSQPALFTPISYTNVSMGYAGNLNNETLRETFSAAANFGLRYTPNSAETFANKRFAGHPNYFYLRADENLIVNLPKGFHLQLRVAGQYAEEPLISNENYSIAGADGVRGYLEAETLGDSAIKGTLQFDSPVWMLHGAAFVEAFVYYDLGVDDVIDPLSNEPGRTRLRSVGAGLNLWPGRPLSGAFTWADPLTDGPRTRRGSSRLLFDLRASF